MALGIVSFVIVALVGLMGVLLGNSRQSTEDTELVSAIATTSAWVRATSALAEITNKPVAYFNGNGALLSRGGPGGAIPSGALYRVVLTDVSPSSASARRRVFQAAVSYPPPAFSRTNVVLISRYGLP